MSFFEQLALRFPNENDLSDITWCLLTSNASFQKYFIEFFFGENQKFGKPIDIIREFTKDNSRVDFSFIIENQIYIIEVKKWDRNYHYEQYKETYKTKYFAFISIYAAPKSENVITKTWTEFIDYIEKLLPTFSEEEERFIVTGYLEYLKRTCGIVKYENFNFSNINSLYYFYDSLEKKILLPTDDYETSIYNNAKGIDTVRYGTYFYIKDKKTNTELYPWIGIFFGYNNPMIYIEINQKWCDPVYKKIDPEIENIELKYSKKMYKDDYYDNAYIIELKTEYYNLLLEETDIDKDKLIIIKINILTEYFNEAFKYLFNI